MIEVFRALKDFFSKNRLTAIAFEFCVFFVGFLYFIFNRKTPRRSHQGMVNLFCLTSGHSNDFFSKIISAATVNKLDAINCEGENGLLGRLDPSRLNNLVSLLNENGYIVFENALSEALCDQILDYAQKNKCYRRRLDAEDKEKVPFLIESHFSRKSPESVRYDFLQADLMDLEIFQSLMSDPTILSLASAYLKTQPILDLVAMWWHTSYSQAPDSNAAQFFHFDLDRLKWLKFFFYITDVTEESGPHCFVSGSHKTGAIPDTILQKGYSRLSDEEVVKAFGADKIITFSGKRGTIIAEDTRGLHKGRHVQQGDRLLFQLQFSNSLFGAEIEATSRVASVKSPLLAKQIREYPGIFKILKN